MLISASCLGVTWKGGVRCKKPTAKSCLESSKSCLDSSVIYLLAMLGTSDLYTKPPVGCLMMDGVLPTALVPFADKRCSKIH